MAESREKVNPQILGFGTKDNPYRSDTADIIEVVQHAAEFGLGKAMNFGQHICIQVEEGTVFSISHDTHASNTLPRFQANIVKSKDHDPIYYGRLCQLASVAASEFTLQTIRDNLQYTITQMLGE